MEKPYFIKSVIQQQLYPAFCLLPVMSYIFMSFIIVRMLRPSISGLVSFSWSSTLLISSTLAMMYLPSAE